MSDCAFCEYMRTTGAKVPLCTDHLIAASIHKQQPEEDR